MAISFDKLMYHAAKTELEHRLGCKVTNKEFEAYCDAAAKERNQEEVDSAILLLESMGYKVTK